MSSTRASTPRARVSSTIRSDWSTATTSRPCATRRSANSPWPQPTSSTRRGRSATTSSNATSSGWPPRRRAHSDCLPASPFSSEYSRRTTSGSFCSATRPGAGLLVRGDLVPDLLERAADQPRHVHLRDPDLLRDLRLGQPLEEPQVQDHALALVEHLEPRRQHRAILGHLVLVLDLAERLERIELLTVLRAAA